MMKGFWEGGVTNFLAVDYLDTHVDIHVQPNLGEIVLHVHVHVHVSYIRPYRIYMCLN